jgi:hypothetical protein
MNIRPPRRDQQPMRRSRPLLALHGLPAKFDDPQHMMYREMSDDTARREGGKRDILAAIAGRPI